MTAVLLPLALVVFILGCAGFASLTLVLIYFEFAAARHRRWQEKNYPEAANRNVIYPGDRD